MGYAPWLQEIIDRLERLEKLQQEAGLAIGKMTELINELKDKYK